jgi:hypothetical protein
MAAFLFLFRASCGRRCSSPGINLIPSVDQRRRSVRFVVTLNCLVTRWEKYKTFGFSRGYSTNLRLSCVSIFYCRFIFRSTYGTVILLMRWRQGIQWWRYADRWSVKSVELWGTSWVILLFQHVPRPAVDKIKRHRSNVTVQASVTRTRSSGDDDCDKTGVKMSMFKVQNDTQN